MIDIPLQAIANQELSIPLDGARFVLRIKEAAGAMVCSIERDGVTLIRNTRLVADQFVLPYGYLHAGFGNFFVGTTDEEIPYWDKFGVTQFMVYVTEVEIAAADSSFDPRNVGPLTPPIPNLPIGLFLNGVWNLDGSQSLNGFFE